MVDKSLEERMRASQIPEDSRGIPKVGGLKDPYFVVEGILYEMKHGRPTRVQHQPPKKELSKYPQRDRSVILPKGPGYR